MVVKAVMAMVWADLLLGRACTMMFHNRRLLRVLEMVVGEDLGAVVEVEAAGAQYLLRAGRSAHPLLMRRLDQRMLASQVRTIVAVDVVVTEVFILMLEAR
jgi:hypothetical protein